MRSDAVRNRELILSAAGEVLAEHGPGVDVRHIARTAGVGMGTLYRHFTTKDELLRNVVMHRFRAFAAQALRDADSNEDPWQALGDFMTEAMERSVRFARFNQDAVALDAPSAEECAALLHPLMEGLIGRCFEQGLIRDGVTVEDLKAMLTATAQFAVTSDADAPARRRHLQISLDGLLSCHGQPLGGGDTEP